MFKKMLPCLLLWLFIWQYSTAATHTRDTVFDNGQSAGAEVKFDIDVASETDLDESDVLSISASIKTLAGDVGRPGKIYLVAFHNGAAWMKTSPVAWLPWNRSFSTLAPLAIMESGLAENITIDISNELSGLPGDFSLYVGYSNAAGKLLYNADPVQFIINQDFSRAESGEALQAGEATVFNTTKDAFSLPSASLSFTGRSDFSVGNSFFRNPWVSAPATTTARDGLGPQFNTNACQNCHIKDGRGHPPENNQDSAISMLLRLSIPPKTEQDKTLLETEGSIPEPNYGGQLQDFAIAGVAPEGQINLDYETSSVFFDDGYSVELRKPIFKISQLNYGPLAPDTMISPRVAPPMIGLGLLDAITEDAILARADPHDLDGDGISGRANRVWDVKLGKTTLGRFGWKANAPNVKQQSAGAFNGDMGLTTSLFTMDGCTTVQTDCQTSPNGGDPEVSDEILDFVTFYASNLAVPARRNVDKPEVLEGKRLFHAAQCTACHIPKLQTGHSEITPELTNQTIRPYTDLLLHDMGEGLADNRPDFLADGREWRTQPLWGIGLTETVNGHTNFLHDGRARNLMEAILWHDGEAAFSKQHVLSLNEKERSALIQFLESL